MTYEPWGALKTATMGNGLSVANDWGSEGRLASKRLYETATSTSRSHLAYLYDGNDNIGAITDQLNDANSVYYGYDPNDRLTLTSLVSAATPGAESYSYTIGTNRLASFTDSSGARSIAYDARGNTLTETRPGSVSVVTSYDGYGRLLSYARTGDPSQANVYNGLDDRVRVTSGSTTRSYVFDADGRMLGEYDTSAADPVVETIWLSPEVANDNAPFGGDDGTGGYAPLAIAGGSGTNASLYWVHGNHLGVPIAITDPSGAAATPTGYTAVGFPGQTRTLSDLYYNRYRDYDTTTGRYIQADPIGLAGGSNLFLYAEANPLKYIDPKGLAYFAYRPLDGYPWFGYGAVDSRRNTVFAHEQLFFDRPCMGYKNIGFFADSARKTEINPQGYRRLPDNYDDGLICQAVKNVHIKPYELTNNNCQHWADEVRLEYQRLLNQRRRRRSATK